MSITSLVVDSDPILLAATAGVLSSLGYTVITATSFDEARKHLLSTEPLLLLIADVRLGPFNGLQIAFRARALYPKIRIIVTDRTFDPTLEAETKRLGGTYLARPFTSEELTSLISRPSDAPQQSQKWPRRWLRQPVFAGLAAAVGPREARVLNVSYGGLCLEFARSDSKATLPPTLAIELMGVGVPLTVHPVWTRPGESSGWLCGAEVIASDREAETQWRNFVDSCAAS